MSAVRALRPTSYAKSVRRLYPLLIPVAGGSDTTPDAFAFTDQSNVPLSTVCTSNTITVTGINAPATITVTGGTYSINGGAFTSSSGTVNNLDTVQARNTSSGSYSTAVNTTVTIGGVSDTFTTTTINGFPVLVSNIPNLTFSFNSGSHNTDLSVYFSGATSYAISPAVPAGWSFNTSTAVLTATTGTQGTNGPYTVTATNAQGSTPSNTFTVTISAWIAAVFNSGTAYSNQGVMGSVFLADGSPVPAGASWRQGFAHDQTGKRYVALWPSSNAVAYEGTVARRTDGAMVIATSGTAVSNANGIALTARGEVISAVANPDQIHNGWPVQNDGTVCLSATS